MSPVKLKGGGWSSRRSRILGYRAPYIRGARSIMKMNKEFLAVPLSPTGCFCQRAPHSTAARAGTRPTSHYLSPQTSLLPASGGPHHYRDPGWSRFVWHSATCMPYASVCPQWSTTFTCLGVRGSQVGPLHLLLLATIAKTEAPFLHLHFARW